jgi:hypothetical protein
MSPLLLVLASGLLQCVINQAHDMGVLHVPIPAHDQVGFPVIQYADDTIMVMKVDQRQLLCLKAILETFAQSKGLRVNYRKIRCGSFQYDPGEGRNHDGGFWLHIVGDAIHLPRTFHGYHETKG